MSNKKNYALPIAMMFALFFMISFVTGLQNPMGIIVKEQFHLSNLLSQFGNFANFIAYAVIGIPAGIILKKKGYKFTSLTAIIFGLVGVLISILSSFIYNPETNNWIFTFCVYLFGALISGFSMCMLNTVVNPMLNTLGSGGNHGNQLIQFGGSINSVGATIVPIFIGNLMGSDLSKTTLGNARPALWIALGIFALTFIVISFVNIPEPHIEKASNQKNTNKHSPMAFRHFVLGIIAIFLYVGVEVGIANTANLMMTHNSGEVLKFGLGMNTTIAGSIVGTYWFLMLIGRLLGGSFGGKISSKLMLRIVSSIAIILIILAIIIPLTHTVKMPVIKSDLSFGLSQVPLSIMLIILCGLCTSVMWGSIFNLSVEGLGKYTPAASGIFMVMVCGGGILPLIQSAIADATNYVSSYWVIVGALVYILFYALFGYKNVNKNLENGN
ncbi:MAG: MFS transporter [Bacteroidales bacterium]